MKQIHLHHLRLGLGVASLFLCGAFMGACSDDSVKQNNGSGSACKSDETENPITGECVPKRQNPTINNTNNPNKDASPDLDMGMDRPDLPPADMPPTMVDLGTDTRCATMIDSDGDGLTNSCECTLGTDPGNSDTDGDTLPDGYEDRNKNCRLDTTETNGKLADTDGDGLNDGYEERNGLNPLSLDTDGDEIPDGVEDASCLDPKKVDTDGDGLSDTEEDLNKDGKIGVCAVMPRQYQAACAQGELDPCSSDSDGDGTPDGDEISALGCRAEYLNNIPQPKQLNNTAGDFRLAISTATTDAVAMSLAAGVNANVFNHQAESYAGFVASMPKPTQNGGIEGQRDELISRIKASFGAAISVNSGRRTFTHDGHNAIVGIKLNLKVTGRPDIERDRVLKALLASSGASHSLNDNFNASVGDLAVIFSVIERSSVVIVSAAVASDALHQSRTLATAYLVDDATSVTNLASSGAMLEPQCVSYRVDDRPSVDFIWVVDGSGSMSDENAQVRNYANDFVQILTASNIDWRLGVVSANCSDIDKDTTLGADVKQLYGTKCTLPPLPFPIPIPMGRYKNGMLCDKNGAYFTRDANKFKDCIDEMARQSTTSEHTASISPAAIARALPRQDNNDQKLRPNAATVVISVTDEFDDLFQGEMGWRDAGGSGEPPNDPTTQGPIDFVKLDRVVKPFADYLLRPDIGATLFGIFWVPGQACSGASEAAVGIQRMVDKTGGASGNICGGNLQNMLRQIAIAATGLASGLRVQGVPVTPTIKVRVGDVATQTVLEPMRSRDQGWDYDVVTNAVLFNGQNPPRTNDRVVITYLRWQGSTQMCTTNSDCPNNIQKQQCVQGVCI